MTPRHLPESEVIAQFQAALATRDIVSPRNLVTDGKLHRCDAAGRGRKNDAVYLLHLNGLPAGGFENHRDGLGWGPFARVCPAQPSIAFTFDS